jgi:hypothetical protein
MDKWEALKTQLEKIGRGDQMYIGHILMMMEELEKNPEWDLKKLDLNKRKISFKI